MRTRRSARTSTSALRRRVDSFSRIASRQRRVGILGRETVATHGPGSFAPNEIPFLVSAVAIAMLDGGSSMAGAGERTRFAGESILEAPPPMTMLDELSNPAIAGELAAWCRVVHSKRRRNDRRPLVQAVESFHRETRGSARRVPDQRARANRPIRSIDDARDSRVRLHGRHRDMLSPARRESTANRARLRR